MAALLIAAAAACGGGSSPNSAGGSPFVFESQEACDRDLATTPADVTVFGARAGDYLADRFSLAAGDFDGDGLDDLLVGAPLGDGPDNRRENAGEAYIVFGTRNLPAQVDLAQAAAFTVFGERPGDNLGFTVAAGDVNGDERADALIGARFADTPQVQDAGRLYVILGRPTLAETLDLAQAKADVTVSGNLPGGFLTIALAAGDVTGDGIDDMVLGEAGGDGPDGRRQDAGQALAVPGAKSLPPDIDAENAAVFTVYGAQPGDALPNDLAAGDIDGDGRAEMIIGAPFSDAPLRPDAGKVYIVPVPSKGGRLDLRSRGDYREMTGGSRKDGLGFQVAAGDVNGDGFADVIAGARDADGPDDALNNAGEVHIWLGGKQLPKSRDLADTPSDSVIIGSDAGDSLGISVAAGDLNGDGTDDILAGAPVAGGCDNAAPEAGDAYAVFGRSPLPPSFRLMGRGDLTFLGEHAGDGLGFSVAIGDFNGDGLGDAILGAIQADGPNGERPDSGEAYVVLGQNP